MESYNNQGHTTSSKRIIIPKKKDNLSNHNCSENYDLTKNCFDPNKHSPPNVWKTRLLERIETYCESRNSFNFNTV